MARAFDRSHRDEAGAPFEAGAGGRSAPDRWTEHSFGLSAAELDAVSRAQETWEATDRTPGWRPRAVRRPLAPAWWSIRKVTRNPWRRATVAGVRWWRPVQPAPTPTPVGGPHAGRTR